MVERVPLIIRWSQVQILAPQPIYRPKTQVLGLIFLVFMRFLLLHFRGLKQGELPENQGSTSRRRRITEEGAAEKRGRTAGAEVSPLLSRDEQVTAPADVVRRQRGLHAVEAAQEP